jgi:hypothetical protein
MFHCSFHAPAFGSSANLEALAMEMSKPAESDRKDNTGDPYLSK